MSRFRAISDFFHRATGRKLEKKSTKRKKSIQSYSYYSTEEVTIAERKQREEKNKVEKNGKKQPSADDVAAPTPITSDYSVYSEKSTASGVNIHIKPDEALTSSKPGPSKPIPILKKTSKNEPESGLGTKRHSAIISESVVESEVDSTATQPDPAADLPPRLAAIKEEPKHTKVDDSNMYMKEVFSAETEEGIGEEHKSVVSHLLSQVKLGMDLSKVVLPTFILEKRSLLEMYADFFSHSDYFVQIAKKPTAEERIIACVRFYLSTFSAGRSSTVAKKPYNPILGEFFCCFWDHPSLNVNKESKTPNMTGAPVPWCSTTQLAFLGEQVSHHPPISAFYAEHRGANIQFNGHIWTKSKFLGLSVAVQNVGQGAILLLDLNEEYIVNFPSGFGRSILTVPWIELGGDCTITCEKSGYTATAKFHTKPIFGGKVHRVTGDVKKQNTKKPICTFDGEWNGVISCKYSTGKTENLFDVSKPKITKKVRKIEYQDVWESRRLWQKVTESLTNNNIDAATEGKRFLEDKQRREAKERAKDGTTYEPKYFEEDDDDNWIFKSTLANRRRAPIQKQD